MKNRTDGKNESRKPKPELDDKEQSEQFIETAKELETDTNAEAFGQAFKTVVPPKTPNKNSKK